MRILTTSDLDGVVGGIDMRLPVRPGMAADSGFGGAIGGAWGVGWAIGTFVGNNIDSYGDNANGLNPGGSTGMCRPEPAPADETNNCDANGSCW